MTIPKYSKYFNLHSVPKGWTPEEFSRAVLTMEELSHQTLLHLVEQFGIRFTSADPTLLDEEELISVLLDDVEKPLLLQELDKLRKG